MVSDAAELLSRAGWTVASYERGLVNHILRPADWPGIGGQRMALCTAAALEWHPPRPDARLCLYCLRRASWALERIGPDGSWRGQPAGARDA